MDDDTQPWDMSVSSDDTLEQVVTSKVKEHVMETTSLLLRTLA